jgi:hypothetical protein
VHSAVVVAAVGTFLFAFVWRFLTFTGFTNDHYAHLALAQQMLLGERPIRDFSDPGWPLTYLISAAAWHLAGSTMAVEWFIVTVGFSLGAVFTVVAAHRLSRSILVALLIAALELLVLPRTYSYPKMLAYGAAGWALLALATRPTRPRIILMGMLIAVAFLLRHDHGVYIGAASAVCVVMTAGRDWRAAVTRAGLLTLASGAFIAPWALYVALNGGLVNYFDRALEYARIEANATRLSEWPGFTLVPGEPLFGVARPNRPLAQVEWRSDVTDAQRQSLERRYGLEHVRERDGSHFYYVRDASPANIRALADDPSIAGTVGLGRVQRPRWRELLANLSPLRLAPALHNLHNAQTWLYWLFWMLPLLTATVVICDLLPPPMSGRFATQLTSAGSSVRAKRTDPARRAEARVVGEGGTRNLVWSENELAAVAGLTALTFLVNSGFLRDPLSDRLADALVPPALLAAWLAGTIWTRQWQMRRLQVAGRVLSLIIAFVTTAAVAAIAALPERIDYTGIRDGTQGVRNRAAAVAGLLAQSHRQTIAPPSRVSAGLMPFFAYLDRCTSPADQLIVTGDFADILVLGGRGFAGDGVTFGVWYSSVVHQAWTVADMKRRPALLTVLIGEKEFQARYPRVADYIAHEYEPMAGIEIEEVGRVQVLSHRRRAASGLDAETGWPCFR